MAGATNYADTEVKKLLDLVQEELPVSASGWSVIGERYRKCASEESASDFGIRADSSLKQKFRQANFNL